MDHVFDHFLSYIHKGKNLFQVANDKETLGKIRASLSKLLFTHWVL